MGIGSVDVHAVRGLANNVTVGVRIDNSILRSFRRSGIDVSTIASKLRPYVLGDTADATWFLGDGGVRTTETPEDVDAYDVSSTSPSVAYDIVYRDELPPTDRTKPVVVLPGGAALRFIFNEYGDEVLSIDAVEVDSEVDSEVPLIIEPDATYRDKVLYRFQFLV